jgi:CO/xanthine dehydrogenase FAD-binding subunit
VQYDVRLVRPASLKELWAAVAGLRGPYAFLAGGTDLVVREKHFGDTPRVWVDLSRLKELKVIEEKKGHLLIGARATWAEVERSAAVRKWAPSLAAVCSEFASPPVRTLATVGGNCANASPAGDGIPALVAEGAVAVLAKGARRRDVLVEDFILGPRRTVLEKHELVLGFRVEKRRSLPRGAFLKLAPRKGLAIAKVAAAVSARVEGGRLADVRIALGAVGPKVLRAREAEAYLEGKEPSPGVLKEAQRLARGAAKPITDHRSTADYRREMAGVLVRRALERISTVG